MKYSWFIKSWRKDRFFLDYCLRSLVKNAKGFDEIVVVLPEQDKPHFELTDFHGARVVWVDESDGMPGYMRQQVVKVNADQYTDADYIFITDSDTFFFREFHYSEYFTAEGKPIALYRDYGTLEDPQAEAWRPITEKALQIPVYKETMCSHPFIFHRDTLKAFRNYMERTHRCSVEEYVRRQPGTSWSEFNSLYYYCLAFEPQLYDWRRANTPNDYPRPLIQAWSWAQEGDEQGLTEKRKAMYEEYLN